MEMDDYVDEFNEEDDEFMEATQVDWEYEFDAAQYFDFCRPETPGESQEAERWFSIAGNYPASPLVVKFKLGGGIQREHETTTSSLGGNTTSDGDTGSQGSSTKGREGVMEAKTKAAPSLSRQSSLLKPTVSHLAKLNQARDILLSNHLCARYQKSLIAVDGKILKQGVNNLETKRQKLEMGYLRRGSRLKHQPLLLHKMSKTDGNASPNAAYPKLKVTIPKEPALETLQRANSRRSRTNSECSERSELEAQSFKARSANRKIFKPPSPAVKSTQKLTSVQAFNFETTARALQRSSASDLSRQGSDISLKSVPDECKRSKSEASLKKEKSQRTLKTKSGYFSSKIYPTKEDPGSEENNANKTAVMVHNEESNLHKEETLSQKPPTELFNKLSISSEFGSDTVSQPKSRLLAKDCKENAPDSFQKEMLFISVFPFAEFHHGEMLTLEGFTCRGVLGR